MSKINKIDLLRICYRSLYLGGAGNFERMQNLGLTYILAPLLKKLHPEKEKLKEALKRHLEFFNTHPYMASFLIGVVISMEEDISENKGWVKPERINDLKTHIAGPLSALGDSLFWATLRPFAALMAITIIILLEGYNKLWGPVFFLIFYNIFHFYVRFIGIWKGYKLKASVVQLIQKMDLQGIIRIVDFLGLVVLEILVIMYVYPFPMHKMLYIFGLFVLFFIALRRGFSSTRLVGLVVIVGIIAAYLGV